MILNANALHIPLVDNSVQCVVTSPPYFGLRDYQVAGQIGLEQSPDEYVSNLVAVFREVKRILRDDGTCWVNLGDSYNANTGTGFNGNKRLDEANRHTKVFSDLPPKNFLGIPWRVAFALQADGWYLRSEVTWCKKNPMPESVTDRPTSATEKVFLFTKSARYFYDAEAVREPAVNGDPTSPRGSKGVIGPENGGRRKQDETGNRRYTGFNAHWDEKERKEFDDSMGGGGSGFVGHSGNQLADGTFLTTRNMRNYWILATQPTSYAHFATFPEKLVEPCIKAGTSERGCCPKCGKPWVRVTEKIGGVKNDDYSDEMRSAVMQGGKASTTLNGKPPTSVTKGWQPSCSCDAGEPVPCVVFDPFAGSGTVERVAIRLRRRSFGTELNFRYISEIVTKRTADIQ